MSIFKDFVAFATRYAGEAKAAGNALSAILDTLPIHAEDREKIKSEIDKIAQAPASILAWASKAVEPKPVTINKADINSAVAAYLKANPPKATEAEISAAVAAYLKANPPAAPAAK
jgi:hypothetical protein